MEIQHINTLAIGTACTWLAVASAMLAGYLAHRAQERRAG